MERGWLRPGKTTGGWKAADRGLRLAAVIGMVALLGGPATHSSAPRTTAAALEWSDARPPLTDEADSIGTDGFRHLPDFGNVLHAITVAPNGDIFAAGAGAEVDVNGDGDCDDPADGDANITNADGDCDVVTSPVIFKSTDGGMKWRAASVAGAGAGATVHQIAVSPDYPTDDFVLAVFSDLATPASNLNGIAWSTDAGLTFPLANVLDGADDGIEPDLAGVFWTTAALSPDFNFTDGNGEIAIGGMYVAGAGSTGIITTPSLKSPLNANTLVDIAETTPGAADGWVVDRTVSLSYSASQTPVALARLFVLDNTNTFGQVRSGSWPATVAGAAGEILDDDTAAFGAQWGTIGFDDDYAAGGSFFAGAGAGGAVGGVFRFNGAAWAERTLGDNACDAAVDSLTISGNGSSTLLLASLAASNLVCRSTNEGSSWSDANADGGDSVCDECRVLPAGAMTRIANNRTSPANVYWTTSGNLGGVFKSASAGGSWQDTGLTNQPYVVNAMEEIDAGTAFATASGPPSGVDALFFTASYGTAAGWVRSLRTSRTDLVLSLPPGFGTHQTAYARFSTTTLDPALKTTDGGRTWDTTSADPFEASPESNETITGSSARNATTFYVGGNKGHVAVTTDGGNTWTVLAKDFGQRIDEFDFADPSTFFVTALDSDTTLKVWQTRDGGATFTQAGNAPWGTGDGTIDTVINGYNAADNTGHLLVMTTGATTTDEVYRMAIGDPVWTDLDLDVTWRTLLGTGSGAAGDGVMATLWSSASPNLVTTYHPFTGNTADFDPNDAADTERRNLLLALPLPPVTTGTVGTGASPDGYTLQTVAQGRVMELTFTNAFRAGVTLTQPASNANVPTNVGADGIPVVFRWDTVAGADAYELLIGLDPMLSDGVVLSPATNLVVIDDVAAPGYPLIRGNTYYWKVRVKVAEAAVFEGPWSPIRSFTVGADARVAASPNSGVAGIETAIEGLFFGPGETVEVRWDNPAVLLATPVTDSTGTFTVNVNVPAGAVLGAHVIRATGGSSGKTAVAGFTINVPVPAQPALAGRVALQVMGNPAGDANEQRWANYGLTVTLYPAGSGTPHTAVSTTTDRLGNFALALPDLPTGNYDVRVKGAHTLSNQKNNLALPQPSGAPPVDFGTLKTGDLSNNDVMDGADYSIMVTNFATVGGPIVLPRIVGGSDGGSTLPQFAVVPAAQHLVAGAIIPVDLRLRAGAQPVDSVNLTAVFPPELLQAVTSAGAAATAAQEGEALPVVLVNSIDNERGLITFAAGRQPMAQPPSGEITVARLYFRALAPVDAPLPVGIAQTGGIGTAAFFQGRPLTQP